MNIIYDVLKDKLDQIKNNGSYRVFMPINRIVNKFPNSNSLRQWKRNNNLV